MFFFFLLSTGYFKQFDQEGSGVAEMTITEVSSVLQRNSHHILINGLP